VSNYEQSSAAQLALNQLDQDLPHVRRFVMRSWPVYLLLLSELSIPACAASSHAKIPEEQLLAALEQHAVQASSKAQGYLYTQLVHEMIEYSAHEYAAGNSEKATRVLTRTQEFTHKIRSLVAGNSKKLKDTQILLRRTAFRMTELLHTSSYEDRSLIQQTLAQLNQAQDDVMMQVFNK
jgi:hypothetical protein